MPRVTTRTKATPIGLACARSIREYQKKTGKSDLEMAQSINYSPKAFAAAMLGLCPSIDTIFNLCKQHSIGFCIGVPTNAVECSSIEELAKIVKNGRSKKNLSQTQVSKLAGVSNYVLAFLETKRGRVSMHIAHQLLCALDIGVFIGPRRNATVLYDYLRKVENIKELDNKLANITDKVTNIQAKVEDASVKLKNIKSAHKSRLVQESVKVLLSIINELKHIDEEGLVSFNYSKIIKISEGAAISVHIAQQSEQSSSS